MATIDVISRLILAIQQEESRDCEAAKKLIETVSKRTN